MAAAKPMTSSHDEADITGLMVTPVQRSSSARPPSCLARRTSLELGCLAALAVALAAVLALGVSLGVSRASANKGSSCISPVCVHALGGGRVNSGGMLDSTTKARCEEALHAYAASPDGVYWQEVQLAADSAMHALGLLGAQAAATGSSSSSSSSSSTGRSSSGLSRSLLVARRAPPQPPRLGGPVRGPVAAPAPPPTPSKDQFVVFDIDETVLSNLPQLLDPVKWPWDKWEAAGKALPLTPTRDFYRALCSAGYSVAFVTGRKEAARNTTVANLEAAGYGGPCGRGPPPFYGGSSSGGSCCYTALYLRPVNETRIASVYKPWARQQLLAAAGPRARLAALVGDQYSDLNGEHAAPMAFKLPNPWYYIL